MNNVQILFVGNDTVLEVDVLKNELTGAYMNSATVTVSLADESGNAVVGESWPKTLNYVSGSDGTYRATLAYGMVLVVGRKYNAQVVADAGSGLRAAWTIPCVARERN